MPERGSWEQTFVYGKGQNALETLDQDFSAMGLSVAAKLQLRCAVLDDCYRASAYRRANDPYELRRRANTRSLSAKQLKQHQGAISKLRKHIRSNPKVTGVAFGSVILDTKLKTATEPREAVALFDDILRRYSVALNGKKHLIKTGVGTREYACLHFEKSLAERRRNRRLDTETALLFRLVQLFRLFSGAKDKVCLQRGEQMPSRGEPYYDLAATLVNATFDRRVFVDGEAAENRLSHFLGDNKDVLYIGWPQPRKGVRP